MKTRDLIFQTLARHSEAMTQAQLRLTTERSKASISRTLAEVVKEGSVIRKDFPTTQDGKQPSEYRLREALRDRTQDVVSTGSRGKQIKAKATVIDSDAAMGLIAEHDKLQRQLDHLVAAIKITIFDMSVGDFSDHQLRDALTTLKDQ